MSKVSYRIVTTKLRGLRPDAALVDAPSSRDGTVWIPRSLIHGGDDLKLDRAIEAEEVTFRLMDWKAEEIGFS